MGKGLHSRNLPRRNSGRAGSRGSFGRKRDLLAMRLLKMLVIASVAAIVLMEAKDTVAAARTHPVRGSRMSRIGQKIASARPLRLLLEPRTAAGRY